MGETVCDAGPLIHLDELGSLDLMEGFAPLPVPECPALLQRVIAQLPPA